MTDTYDFDVAIAGGGHNALACAAQLAKAGLKVFIAERNSSVGGGTTNGGERTLAQTGYFRPVPGYSQYRSPIKHLYMTGASCHPGGGITAMGMVTANVMLEDFGLADDEL